MRRLTWQTREPKGALPTPYAFTRRTAMVPSRPQRATRILTLITMSVTVPEDVEVTQQSLSSADPKMLDELGLLFFLDRATRHVLIFIKK